MHLTTCSKRLMVVCLVFFLIDLLSSFNQIVKINVSASSMMLLLSPILMWWSASLGFKIDGPTVSLGGVHLFPIQLYSFVYPHRSIAMFQRMTIWKCPSGISLLSIASRDHLDHDCLRIILPPVWSECTHSLIICLWTTFSSVHWFII
jgi:hypothetical protein